MFFLLFMDTFNIVRKERKWKERKERERKK